MEVLAKQLSANISAELNGVEICRGGPSRMGSAGLSRAHPRIAETRACSI